jgi:hypothetical protein
MTRSQCLAAVRWLVIHAFLGCCLFTSFGCLTYIYAQGYYDDRKEEIRNTHAAITVRGRVVDEAGRKLPPRSGSGIVTITGLRDSVRFQMESEGRGNSTELVCNADSFGDTFSVHLDNVREATIVFTQIGYRPAMLRVEVRPGTKDKPVQPVVINDAVIVMHPENEDK